MKSIQDNDIKFDISKIRSRMQRYNQEFSLLEYDFSKDAKVKKLFDWQLQAVSRQIQERFGITIAPCGSGKTVVVQTLAAWDACQNPDRRQVILVAETQHADNFTNSCDLVFKLVGNGRSKPITISWGEPENFCDITDQSKIAAAKAWLLAPKIPLHNMKHTAKGSVAIMTHMLFNLIFKNCTEKEKNIICKNLSLFVDESHHLKGLSKEEDADMTRLSRVVNFILSNANSFNSKIFLCTATFFRGDYAVIISPENLKKFKTYQLDFARHFMSLGIETFDIIHCFFDTDPIEQVGKNLEKCFKEGFLKQYIVVPPMANWRGNWRQFDEFCQSLIKRATRAVAKHRGCSEEQASARILNLVNKSTQTTNKKMLRFEPKYGQDISQSQFDIVITCRIGREGTDWVPCSVVHNTSPESSPPFAVQTIGRILRRFAGKKQVRCYYYLKNIEADSKEDLIVDRVHYLLLTMLMDESLRPILLPAIKSENKNDNSSTKKNKKDKEEYVSMEDIFRDKWQLVKKELVNIFALQLVTDDNVDMAIDQILEKYKDYKKLATEEDIRLGLKLFILKCKNSRARNEEDFIDVKFIRENNIKNLFPEKGDTLFYRISPHDFKTFSILKEDALEPNKFNLLCQHIPEVKARELGKKRSELTISQIRQSLEDLYDFKEACTSLLSNQIPLRAIAKQLKITESTLTGRIEMYNSIFRKLGKDPIVISNKASKNKNNPNKAA